MELEIKTLTPLWTGGAEAGRMDRIHETGIIGSLRWWYEAILRGLGGDVCNPTSDRPEERCPRNDGKCCEVCKLFGATGWRRQFRLIIEDKGTSEALIQHPIKVDRSYIDSRGNTRTPIWFFPNKPRSGSFTIQIQNLTPDFPPEAIGGLLQFVADWAALGARAQMGFGVIESLKGRFDTRPLYNWLIATIGNRLYPGLPSLRNIFLARIRINNVTEQETFNLKYDLRQLFSGQQNRDLRHFIMGTVQGARMAAKVKVSRPYSDGLMRVWGWIPERAVVYQDSWDRNAVVSAIHQYLKTKYTIEVWREMKSSRDTTTPYNDDTQAFLGSLLRLKEDGNAI